MELQNILKSLYSSKKRVRLFYGDAKTGKCWNDEHTIMGRISKSTGVNPIYILVNNQRSMGGPALLENNIIRITVDKVDIYKHENFHIGKTEQSGLKVFIDEKHHATLKTTGQATRYIDFLEGRRNNY